MLRINARCKDLLQVTRKRSPEWMFEEPSDGEPSLQPLFQYEVDFLHRTVKDFFRVNDIQTFVASRLPKSFNSSDLLCHAFLAQIKVATIEDQHTDRIAELSDLIDDLMHYAREVETQTARPNIILLDELSITIKLCYDPSSHSARPFPDGRSDEKTTSRSIYNQDLSVISKLRRAKRSETVCGV